MSAAADRTNAADTRHHLTVHPPPSKDIQGPENSIPLSPQWLLPKSAENKSGVLSGDSHVNVYPNHIARMEFPKSPVGISEEIHDIEKKRDVWRSSGHRGRWRDEERDGNSSLRKDRRRDGEIEHNEPRRPERWGESLSNRNARETRRLPLDRRDESGTRDFAHEQRHESKWNTRWGPENKESESWREKWSDAGRDTEGTRDKVLPVVSGTSKEAERDADQYSRSWRTVSQNRGRGEPSHHPVLTPTNQVPSFGSGRGQSDNVFLGFSAGRGRAISPSRVGNSGACVHDIGTSEKCEAIHGDSSSLRYTRTRLLDIYRMTDVKTYEKPDGVDGSSLILTEPLDPLAFSAPTTEEESILNGIDKGDIINSGMPPVLKDGSVGRNSPNAAQFRRTRIGSRDDFPTSLEDFKEPSLGNLHGDHVNYSGSHSMENLHPDYKVDPIQKGPSQGKRFSVEASTSEGAAPKKPDEVGDGRANMPENMLGNAGMPLLTRPIRDHLEGPFSDLRDWTTDGGPTASDMNWPRSRKNQDSEWGSGPLYKHKWHAQQFKKDSGPDFSRNFALAKQTSEFLERREANMSPSIEDAAGFRDRVAVRSLHLHVSPEDMSFYYKDPQGEIQGPFLGSVLIGWFEAGYFGLDLPVRLANEPADAAFTSLGDTMPHLRTKVGPPPGFDVSKQSEIADGSIRMKSDHRSRPDLVNEAESRFLESLMSGNVKGSKEKFKLPEGPQEYLGTSTGVMSTMAVDGGPDANYLLAQRMTSDRQGSVPSSLHYWPGRDTIPMMPNTEVLTRSLSQSKLLPQMSSAPPQMPYSSQFVDIMSTLQGNADKTSRTGVHVDGIPWSNDSDTISSAKLQSGIGILQDKVDKHEMQNFISQPCYEFQQQRLPSQHFQSVSHMVNQLGDHSSSMSLQEQLLSSGIPQDPQMLSLLQQQYLLSQLQINSPLVVPNQLSLLDKFMLASQQQKQEQHQKFLQQQQQQLLAQVLRETQGHQHLGELLGGQFPGVVSPGNAAVDHRMLAQLQESSHINTQISQTSLQTNPISRESVVVENFSDSPKQHVVKFSGLPPEASAEVKSVVRPDVSASHCICVSSNDEVTLTHHINAITKPLSVRLPAAVDVVPTVIGTNGTGESESFRNEVLERNEQVLDRIDENRIGLSFMSSIDVAPFLYPGMSEKTGISFPEKDNVKEIPPVDAAEESNLMNERSPAGISAKETENVEGREVKKASEKKSRKQKNLKAQSSLGQGKGLSKINPSQQLKQNVEVQDVSIGNTESTKYVEAGDNVCSISPPKMIGAQHVDSTSKNHFLNSGLVSSLAAVDTWTDTREVEDVKGDHAPSSQCAWKPAPALKAKSLLEIQQEERQRALAERVPEVAIPAHHVSFQSVTPWAGIVANSDDKQDQVELQYSVGNVTVASGSRSKKSQLHDLLAEEVLAKTAGRDLDIPDRDEKVSVIAPRQLEEEEPSNSVNDFIKAKDTKKSRKRATKSKGVGTKAPSVDQDQPITSTANEMDRSSHQVQQEKEVLPAPPSGPSLGDFVLWKRDQTNPAPAPAWCKDTAKPSRPTSLREIQKEQEKTIHSGPLQTQTVAPKTQANQNHRGSSSSFQTLGSSPSKGASPIPINSVSSAHSKSRAEDDFFWGPLEQSKKETNQSQFPSLANVSSSSSKGKGPSVGSFTHQKSSSNNLHLSPASGSTQSILKEAMGFKEWCESESLRLTGSKDTSFLEFCLKQSTSEAQSLLIENLGSLDPYHKFIDKFINYKELLLPEVIEIAFSCKSEETRFLFDDVNTNSLASLVGDPTQGPGSDASAKGGKKKGKKSKKVMNTSVLGFNVVSNRIMMGEIQTVED